MSNLHFVAIPTDIDRGDPDSLEKSFLHRTATHWVPFLHHVAVRDGYEPFEMYLDNVISGRTQIGMVWDADAAEGKGRCEALIGWQYRRAGETMIAELIFLTGRGMRHWRDLLPELHKYLKRHASVDIVKPICRPGWAPFLKQNGYKVTHYVMERTL